MLVPEYRGRGGFGNGYRSENAFESRDTIKCYSCNGFGHMSKECPESSGPKVVTVERFCMSIHYLMFGLMLGTPLNE